MKGYKIFRYRLSKFFKLKNNQWLKILFSYNKKKNIWFISVVVANTKRLCNDCLNKSEFSPKLLYGKITGKRLGIEALKISLKELLHLEKYIHDTQINVIGANDRLSNCYKYLKRYGYKQFDYIKFGKNVSLMYKKIK